MKRPSVRRLFLAPGRAAAGMSVVAVGTVTSRDGLRGDDKLPSEFFTFMSDYEPNSVRKNRT